MMLMHTTTSSRYFTIAQLLEPSAWPSGVSLHEDDVLVRGESLAAQGRIATPAVRIGEAAPQLSGTTPVRQRFISLIMTRVVAVAGHGDVTIDADLSHCEAYFSEVHVVGRAPAHRTHRVRMHAPGDLGGPRVRLPRDVVVGDILVIPCEGTVTPGDLRCCAATTDDEGDEEAPNCGRHVRAS